MTPLSGRDKAIGQKTSHGALEEYNMMLQH